MTVKDLVVLIWLFACEISHILCTISPNGELDLAATVLLAHLGMCFMAYYLSILWLKKSLMN